MEAATATAPAPAPAAASEGSPPSVPLPKVAQTARFLVRPIPFLEHWRRELGETFHASLFGPGEVVFLSDPQSMKRLFSADRVNTIAPGRNIILRPLLGPGSLLLQEGEEHLRRRRLMLPPFHGERMRAYDAVIARATEEAIARWPLGEPFALHPSMQSITLEVILRAVFGVEDAGRRDELSRTLVEILGATASPATAGMLVPGVRRLPIYGRLGRLLVRTDELLLAEIEDRRRGQGDGREDILSMLVAARFDDGSTMGDEELRDQLMTLLLAGHETTATALAWTFDLLLHRPDALARLREELDHGVHTYLEAVIDESLRVRPVVPFTGRKLRAPAELGGYRLPEGTTVLAAIYLTHTLPELYPDPYAFRPERFLDGDIGEFELVPQGGGDPRTGHRCPGEQITVAVLAALAVRLARLDAETPEQDVSIPLRRIPAKPRSGIVLRVHGST